jgi:hypothetical protein
MPVQALTASATVASDREAAAIGPATATLTTLIPCARLPYRPQSSSARSPQRGHLPAQHSYGLLDTAASGGSNLRSNVTRARSTRGNARSAKKVRAAIERSQPSLPGVSRSEMHVAPWKRVTITERQLKAACACGARWRCPTTSWLRRCCGSCLAGRSGVTRHTLICAIRQQLNCCAAASARWPITQTRDAEDRIGPDAASPI